MRALLIKDFLENEIAAGIDGEQLDARVFENGAKIIGASGIIEQIAVEQFDAGISDLADFGDRAFHVAEGAVGQFGD